MNSTNQQQPQYQTTIGAVTDVGRTRKHNEDYVGFFKPDDPDQLVTYGILLVVCDGVGGAAAGEIASETAVHRILNDYYEASAKMTVQERLANAIQSANAAIYALNEQRERQMATTVVAAVIIDKHLVVAHAGDSRAYLVRGGKITQITEDHSWVEEMVRSGDLTPAEAKVHPWRNRITRGLGMTPTVKVDVTIFDWQPNDILVLCSDGLTRHVEDAEIAQVVTHYPPENAAQRLIDMANQRGGKDNITAIIATTAETETPIVSAPVPEEDAESREPTQVPVTADSVNIPRNKLILLIGLLAVVLMCSFGGIVVLRKALPGSSKTPTPTISNTLQPVSLTKTAAAFDKGTVASTAAPEPKETSTITSTPSPTLTPTATSTPTSSLSTPTSQVREETADSSMKTTVTTTPQITTTPQTPSTEETPASSAQFVLKTMTSSPGQIAALTLPYTLGAGDVAFTSYGDLYLVAAPEKSVQSLDFIRLEKLEMLSFEDRLNMDPVTITLPYGDAVALKQVSFSSNGKVLGVLASESPFNEGVWIGSAPNFDFNMRKCRVPQRRKSSYVSMLGFDFWGDGQCITCGGYWHGLKVVDLTDDGSWYIEKMSIDAISHLAVTSRVGDYYIAVGLAQNGTKYYAFHTKVNNNILQTANIVARNSTPALDDFSIVTLDSSRGWMAIGTKGDRETQVLWTKWDDGIMQFVDPLELLPNSGTTDISGSVTALTFSPDGKVLAGGTDTGNVALWNMSGDLSSSPQLLRKPWNVDAKVKAIAFSDDGLLAVLMPRQLLIYKINALP